MQRISAVRGSGWLFAVHFDHACKLEELDALVGGDLLGILSPPAPRTRAEVSQFLVDNGAKLMVAAMTVGSDPGVQAALGGTQASAATLDALDSTLTALQSALVAYNSANPPPPTYESITAGTNPSWVLGEVVSLPMSDLP